MPLCTRPENALRRRALTVICTATLDWSASPRAKCECRQRHIMVLVCRFLENVSRATLGSPLLRVQLHMMIAAQPHHVERLVVIRMVHFGRRPTFLAWLPLYKSTAQTVASIRTAAILMPLVHRHSVTLPPFPHVRCMAGLAVALPWTIALAATGATECHRDGTSRVRRVWSHWSSPFHAVTKA